jgi:hypothetical protein
VKPGGRAILLNIAGFQACWWACIQGAASGRDLLGPAVVATLAMAHLFLVDGHRRQWGLLAAATIAGLGLEALNVHMAWLAYPREPAALAGAPLWMVALWAAFALTLRHSLAWLRERPLSAMIFGLLGGPLSYLAGVRLGALEFESGAMVGLIAIAAEWGVAMPLLMRWSATTRSPASPRGTRGSSSEEWSAVRPAGRTPGSAG